MAPNSAAEKSGLLRGDIILLLNDTPVQNVAKFRNNIALSAPNSRQKLTILRKGSEMDIVAKIGQLGQPVITKENRVDQSTKGLGMVVKNISKKEKNRLNLIDKEGVIITDITPGSVAQLAGLPINGVITEINQRPIRNMSDFKNAMKSKKRQYLLLVTHRNMPRYYVLQLR